MCRLAIVCVSKNDVVGISKTIASINSQHLDNNSWKLVSCTVIDGASNDRSFEFVKKLNTKCDISIISENDNGIFDAMNKGVINSDSDAVIFLNAGDVFNNENVLILLLNLIKQNPNKIYAGNVKMYWKKRAAVSSLAPWVCHQAVVVPRFLLLNYLFDDKKLFFGDLHLWLRLKRDSKFDVVRVDATISDFELGGVGNNPNYLWKRFHERSALGREFCEENRLVLRFILTLTLYIIWKLFGSDSYYRTLLRYS